MADDDMLGNMMKGMFDFSGVTKFLDTMAVAASQTTAAKKQTAQVAKLQSDKILQSAQDYSQAGQDTLATLQKVQGQQKEAAALAEGNILDRITLIGEQIVNPRAFTQEGRQNQLAEATTQLAVRGQVHNVQIAEATATVAQAEAQEALNLADVNGQMAALRMQIDGMQMANQAFASTELLKQQNLSQIDLPTLQKALIGPPSPDGKIALGGMPYTQTEIRERAKQVEMRDKLALLSPQASNPEYANLLQLNQDLQLATYTIPELDKLKSDGYILPDGTQVAPSLFDQHYLRQNQMQAAELEKKMNQEVLFHQIPQMLDTGVKMSQNIQKTQVMGSPLAQANTFYMTELSAAAKLAETPEGQTPNGKVAQVARIQAAETRLHKAVKDEAVRRAAGDEDLAKLYEGQILGQPISPTIVEDVMVKRFEQNKGFGEILPSDMSLRIQATADRELSTLRQENAQADLTPGMTKRNEKELRNEAARRAFERERKQAGVKGINLIQQSVSQRSDNPARIAGMVPGQLNEIQTRAMTIGLEEVARQEGLTAVEVQAIRTGRPADAGISPTRAAAIAQAMNAQAMAAEYDLYENHKPGLGYEIQQWYQKTLPELARNYTMSLNPTEQAFAGDAVLNEAMKYNDMMVAIDESASDRGKEMALAASTRYKDPERMWPVLLQMDKRLADSQKQMIYHDVIEPTIKQAKSLNLDSEATTAQVFDTLKNFKSNDPVTMSAVKSMLRNLPESMDNYDIGWQTAIFTGDRAKRIGAGIEKLFPWIKLAPPNPTNTAGDNSAWDKARSALLDRSANRNLP